MNEFLELLQVPVYEPYWNHGLYYLTMITSLRSLTPSGAVHEIGMAEFYADMVWMGNNVYV